MKKPILFAAFLCGCLFSSALLAASAEPGQGFVFGPRDAWRLSPQVSIGAFWENNARNTTNNKKAGGGWHVQPSLSLTYSGSEHGGFSMNGFYSMERGFESKNAQDTDSYGINLSLNRQLSRNMTLTMSGAYSRSENDSFYGEGWDLSNPGLSLIDTYKSEHYNFNTALGYSGERWRWSVGLGWNRTKNLTGNKNESDTYNASVMVGRAIAAHHYWNFSLSTSWDDATQSSQSYYAMTGFSGSISNRLTYSTLLGVSFYDYSGKDYVEGRGNDSDRPVTPSYSASLAYKMSRTFALSLALSSQYKPEYVYSQDWYYVWAHTLTGAVNAQWSEKWSSRLNVAFVYEQHVDVVDDGYDDFDRTYLQFSFNTSYRVNSYMSVYAGASWKTDQMSENHGDDTRANDLRADVGLSFVF